MSEINWWEVEQTKQRRRVVLNRDQVWSLVLPYVEDDIINLGLQIEDPLDEWMDECMNTMNAGLRQGLKTIALGLWGWRSRREWFVGRWI
eukprot:2386666-Amphidinium_carterae.1